MSEVDIGLSSTGSLPLLIPTRSRRLNKGSMQNLIQRDLGPTSCNNRCLFFRTQPRFHLLSPRTLKHIRRFILCNHTTWLLPNLPCQLPRFLPTLLLPRSLSLRFSRCSIRRRSSAAWKYSTLPNSLVLPTLGDGPFRASVCTCFHDNATPNVSLFAVNGMEKGVGTGSSKQLAKEEAARQAYYAMGWAPRE